MCLARIFQWIVRHFKMKNKRMKKLLYLFLFTFFASAQIVFARQQFSDAEVTYAVTVEPPEGSGEMANPNLAGGTLVYNFKNYLFRSEMHLGQAVYTNIHDSRTNSAVVLINAGANKYLIKMNESQLKEEGKRFEGITFRDGGETMKIAGYDCRMAVGELADGSTFTVYYAPGLLPENKDYSERFKGLKGVPLKFIMTTRNHMKMTMTATRVTIAPQARALFVTPTSGYRLLTYEELQSMRKSG
jgi:hypothetical protein